MSAHPLPGARNEASQTATVDRPPRDAVASQSLQRAHCFVLPDDEPDESSADVSASALAFGLWGALIWTVLWFFLGVICARHFS